MKKSDLISEQAKYIYLEIGEGYGFNGPEDLAMEIIQDKLDEYAKHITTSQQQTIERLRESLQNVTSSLIAHIGSERAKEWLEVQQAEQLLNTTEPELDEQQLEYKEVEERTERNVHIVGSFMEHCESEGFVIPDHLYESYFNA